MILPAAGEQPWQEISGLHFRDEDGGMVAYTGNPATWEAEAEASIGLQSYSRPHREFQASERKRKRRGKESCLCLVTVERPRQHFFKELL